MITEIMFLIVGAMLGVVLEKLIPKLVELFETYRGNHLRETRLELMASDAVYNWLIKYYDYKHSITDLYSCKIDNFEIRIPFLTKREWSRLSVNLLWDRDIVIYAHSLKEDFRINHRLIKLRTHLGQVLFNEPTLFIDRIEQNSEHPHLHVKSCEYFQMFTLLAALEEETFKAVRKGSHVKTPIRDAICPNTETAARITQRPISIGCQVATVLTTATGYEIIIQTRSHKTITFGGKKAVIPSFGLSPILHDVNSNDILIYNFIKEYCEELFNYKELVTAHASKRVDPFWFYRLPEAQCILDLINNGEFIFECLGFGFDALNGSVNLALLALIKNVAVSNKIKKEIVANWEVIERTESIEPIEFVDFRSAKLEQWLREGKYHISGAFALSRAIERLDQLYSDQTIGAKFSPNHSITTVV